jgi:drug/metabolite transporter (DMT)-like permease
MKYSLLISTICVGIGSLTFMRESMDLIWWGEAIVGSFGIVIAVLGNDKLDKELKEIK